MPQSKEEAYLLHQQAHTRLARADAWGDDNPSGLSSCYEEAKDIFDKEAAARHELGQEKEALIATAWGLHCQARMTSVDSCDGFLFDAMTYHRQEVELWTQLGNNRAATIAQAYAVECQARIAWGEEELEEAAELHDTEAGLWDTVGEAEKAAVAKERAAERRQEPEQQLVTN